MARDDGWEQRLNSVVAKHQALPGQWGVSDCFVLPDDAVEAMTGKRTYPDARSYKTEAGAAKVLLRHGFANLGEAFAARFEAISPVEAQRGDIGVIERDGQYSGGVFTSIGFATRPHEGPVIFLSLSQVTAAFRVE